MDVALDLEMTTRQVVSPRLIEANHILSLSQQELEVVVAAELTANPALDLDEVATCPRCGGRLDGDYCALCGLDQRLPESPPDDYIADEGNQVAADDFDPLTLIASEISLIERILSDVATTLPPDDRPIAEYILHSLDERGYLDVPIEVIATQLERPIEEVERVLRVVQRLAPVGVAARDMRECLLLQLAYLSQQPERSIPPGVWRIVADHLDDLGAHRYNLIARKLGLTTGDVGVAHDFIRTSLTPFPLQQQEARWWKTPTRAAYVVPDVVVLEREGQLTLELIESRARRLRLDPLYASLAADISSGATGTGDYAAADRSHIRQHVTRARLFIANINQRYETLRRISECLLELQRDFVLQGVRELQPLTRGMVAERVGVHESTVSRATANKYVMLPNRQVIPFSTFFVASLSIKDVMREIISEAPTALTDKEICERLRLRGIRIARRTVAKYRATIGIPSSLLRSATSA